MTDLGTNTPPGSRIRPQTLTLCGKDAKEIPIPWDKAMTPDERMFVYLPLEHPESLADQERCLALMKEIAVHPETADMPKWAEAHFVIIRRFGRFPHRNAALGRESTPEEIAFLKEPGSGF